MRIGFDISQTGRLKAGCGYFAYSLIQALAEVDSENEYILYPTFGDAFWDPDWPTTTCQIDKPNFRRGLGHRTFESVRLFWGNPPADFETQLGDPDIIHSNNFFCPTQLKKARLVYTLHDLAFIEHPELTTEQNRINCFTSAFNASLYADAIIAVSEYTRCNFLEIFPHYPADRVVVAYEASRFSGGSKIIRPIGLPPLEPERFWLTVGTVEPRKNHKRLLYAYAKLKAHLGQTFPLVLAGGRGWLMDDFEKVIDDLGLRQDVLLLGYVEDEVLQWLYQNCFAFIYPSLFEGFGLPVIEAMSQGAPVIVSNTTSLPEIVDSAGLLVNPLQEDEIFQAMLKLSTGEVSREVLKDMAIRRAAAFSWTSTARVVLEVYRGVASRRNSLPVESVTPLLQDVYQVWDHLGRVDPLWAVLTHPEKKGGKWDLEEFFETGKRDVRNLLQYLHSLGVYLDFGKALDFGCGVGRLTQALAEHFQEVHGVDIAPSMVETAKSLDRSEGKCFFYLNLAENLRCFPDNTFDFVITLITLQHIPKPCALRYIAEFARVVKPGGIVVFQIPDSFKGASPPTQPSSAVALATHSSDKREPQMLMSSVPYAEVVQTLAENRMRLIDVVEDNCAGPEWLSYRYCAMKLWPSS